MKKSSDAADDKASKTAEIPQQDPEPDVTPLRDPEPNPIPGRGPLQTIPSTNIPTRQDHIQDNP